MSGIQECVLYRNMEHGEILEKMTLLMDVQKKTVRRNCSRESLCFLNVSMV